MLVLTILHSNAPKERVCSKKNKISLKPNIDLNQILINLITVKLENQGDDKYLFPPDVLQKAKPATLKYNRVQKTSSSWL